MTCSLEKMLATWFLTVFSLMTSSLLSSRLLNPFASCRRTSTSRSVRLPGLCGLIRARLRDVPSYDDIDFVSIQKIVRVARLIAHTVVEIANQDAGPSWNPGALDEVRRITSFGG